MYAKKHVLIWLAVLAIAVALASCGTGETQVNRDTSNEAGANAPADAGGGQAAAAKGIEELQAATVQILAYVPDDQGTLVIAWTGSGTIVSPDGLILTNSHVAAPTIQGQGGFDPQTGPFRDDIVMVVAIAENADNPPEPTYIADVVAADGVLDMAVLRITETIEGQAVSPQSLDLPFVELGDSSQLTPGDAITIHGYPGIGGKTITLTTGIISGFESDPRVGERVWIKTDASIHPGNSGGMAANEVGQIIGIPTWLQSDTLYGSGSIGRLGAIDWAKPLIEAARRGQTYQPVSPDLDGKEQFNLLGWSSQAEGSTCPNEYVNALASGTSQLAAYYQYSGMHNGMDVYTQWYLNNEQIAYDASKWEGGAVSPCYSFNIFDNQGNSLPDGTYQLFVYVGPDLNLANYAQTAIGSESGCVDCVFLRGQVIDGDTGRSIPGASVFILEPGTDVEAWLNGEVDAGYWQANANDSGLYSFVGVLREQEFPFVVGAEGYIVFSAKLVIGSDWPSVATLDPIALYK